MKNLKVQSKHGLLSVQHERLMKETQAINHAANYFLPERRGNLKS